MDLSAYESKWVKIDLVNGFYFEGYVNKVGEDFLELKDKTGKSVSINDKSILYVREVQHG